MKKYIIITAAAALLLAACKSTDQGGSVPANGTPVVQDSETVLSDTESDENVSAADIAAAVMNSIELQSPVEKTVDDIGPFYDIDASTVEDMAVFVCGSGAYPDELAVFRFTDADNAGAGAEAARKRLESQTALYTDYTPDEVYKLEDAEIIQKDNWVILTICSDNAAAKEIIENLI